MTLKLSSNVVSDANDEKLFLHKLLLTNTLVSKVHKAFTNGSSANIKFSKTQLHKRGQSGGFLGRLLGLLQKTGLPLMKNVLTPLAKSSLIPLWLAPAASATDAAIQRKIHGSGTTSLMILSEEMEDIMKIGKSLWRIWFTNKRCKWNKKEQKEVKAKEQNGGFLSVLLGTLAASLLGNLLTG